MSSTLLVNEIFGPTVQGEGPSLGRACAFLRVAACNLSCVWCLDPSTPVLMSDWSTRPLSDIVEGDLVMSYNKRRYEATAVQAAIQRTAPERVRVTFSDGRSVIATPEHSFLVDHHKDGRRIIMAKDSLGYHVRGVRGEDFMLNEAVRTEEWWRGWAAGLITGDGHVSVGTKYPKVWLRVTDLELANAYADHASKYRPSAKVLEQKRHTVAGKTVYSVAHMLRDVEHVTALPTTPAETRGWVAGFFDAEGSVSTGQLGMSQLNDKTLGRVQQMVEGFGIPTTRKPSTDRKVGTLLVNGMGNMTKFFAEFQPVLKRKREKLARPDQSSTSVEVISVEPLGQGEVISLTTGSGLYIANRLLHQNCDTFYTWDWSRVNKEDEAHKMEFQDVADKVRAVLPPGPNPMLVISGGEPLLQQDSLAQVMDLLGPDVHVEVETAGTIAPTGRFLERVNAFNVSPKLEHSGNEKTKRYRADALNALRDSGKVQGWKFVAAKPEDLDEVQELVDLHDLKPVFIMPEGVTKEALEEHAKALIDSVIARGWRLTPRLHIQLWGNERGH